ncbi:MAG: hypothetical protein WAV67_11570 [Dokdonella sp.]
MNHAAMLLMFAAMLAGCSEPPAPATIEVPQPPLVEIVAPPAPVIQAAPPTQVITAVPPRDHRPVMDESACRGSGSDGPIVRDASIHRWTDAQGIKHFSDQAPVGEVSDHRVIAVAGTPPVAIEASGHDVNLPTDINQRAVADAIAIDRILRDTLGVVGEQRLRLKIVFVQSPQAYAELIDEPRLASSDGAYSARSQTVYVRMQTSEELTFRVLRHEITHALLHERIGNIALPINEGIAAYFERLQVLPQGGQVDIGGSRDVLARMAPTDAPLALVELLSSNPDVFYGVDRDSNYVRAFGLIGSLMQDAAGRAALAELLSQQHAAPCAPVAAERVFAAAYPGGLNQLAGNWQRWMQAPPAGLHAF